MDMLMKLYGAAFEAAARATGPVRIRQPLAPEDDLVVAWVAERFSAGWASEARVALANRPRSLYIAIGDGPTIVGFCCYDATARGFVGPIGVVDGLRGQGVGAALLHACLADMRALGYAYAVSGAVGAPAFFQRAAGATEIPESTPGVYAGLLRR